MEEGEIREIENRGTGSQKDGESGTREKKCHRSG